jgi:hypothetical protein
MAQEPRETTLKILDMIDDDLLDAKAVLKACLSYMHESDVKDMAEGMGLFDIFKDEEAEKAEVPNTLGKEPLNLNGILTIINSKRDKAGNCYFAVSLDIGKGQYAKGTMYADNVSTLECREKLHWHIVREELGIRDFNRITKGWRHVGCDWEDVKTRLLAQFQESEGESNEKTSQ